MKKVYYQLKMNQVSPLRIGNGENDATDNDLMCDSRGIPFIPGSSIAGVIREKYEKLIGKDSNQLFGMIKGSDISESRILVSDATGSEGAVLTDYTITIRDGVGLDQWGVAIPGHKYDFQVVETKNPYFCVLEWSGDENEYLTEIEQGMDLLVKHLVKDGIQFGARTTRGYGKMQVEARRKQFNFPEEIEQWLAFDSFAEDAFLSGEEVFAEEMEKNGTFITIQAAVKVKGSFSVRVSMERIEKAPDSVALKNHDEKPVIPGTSWAGAFRHHMQEILGHILNESMGENSEETSLDLLFGKNEAGHVRSGIYFGETVIEGGNPYHHTRNAVDRFTQAPKNTALFTDEFWQGGQGTLEIMIEKDKISKLQKQLLEVSLLDLDLGILTFGGAVGTGHGRVEISNLTVDGVDVTDKLKEKTIGFLEEVL